MTELNGPSGINLIPRGPDAFLARLTLVDLAERSLDLQYYRWQDDTVGKLLIGAVMRAADRGVRVRLLIDDVGASPDDRTLLLLDAHPNIEVRLFNPIASRSVKALWMISDFSRVNRRMHNKSITADNQMTIVGGRNIGDEYFEASTVMNYADLDALAIGAAVAAVSARFDRYWNSPIVYGITELRHESPASGDLERAAAGLRAFEQQQRDARYAQAMRESRLSQELRDGRVSFSPARIEVTSDDPIKVEHAGKDRSQNLMPQLRPQFDGARESVMLVSPYFVPRKGGVEFLRSLRARGVRVRVLTNGLASTDVVPVFGKYKKYRRQLLEAGVELYEIDPALRPRRTGRPAADVRGRERDRRESAARGAARQGLVVRLPPVLRGVDEPRSAVGVHEHRDRVPRRCARRRGTPVRRPGRDVRTRCVPPRADDDVERCQAPGMGGHRQGRRAALHERAAREPLAALQGVDVRDPADRIADVSETPCCANTRP